MLTKSFKSFLAEELVGAANNYNIYAFAAQNKQLSNTSANNINVLHENILFGKKINSSDIHQVIPKIPWEYNKVYDFYDNSDENLSEKDFFVINSLNQVYKCIYNNDGANSTVEPQNTSIVSFKTSDGYIWKYMFSLTTSEISSYGTPSYIPVIANTTVTDASVPGSIEFVKIENAGINWNTYLQGNVTQAVSNNIFKINEISPKANGFYTDCGFYINSGSSSGTLDKIVSYFSNTTGTYIKTSNSISLQLGDGFIISPYVNIIGNGVEFKAYSTVNTVSYSIDAINILNAGKNYTSANVYLSANSEAMGSDASFRPIIQPGGGHGSNPAEELFSNKIVIKVVFDNANVTPSDLDYYTFGLIKDIKDYSNTSLAYTNSNFSALSTYYYYNTVSGSIEEGDYIVSTSGATGTVVQKANNTLYISGVSTPFLADEQFISSNTGAIAYIGNTINTSDISPLYGNILHFNNVMSPITHYSNNNYYEFIKIIIDI